MKKKIVTIVLPVLIVIAVIFSFGIYAYQKSFNQFKTDGHIITQTKNSYQKYYFKEGNKYRINNHKVEFKDADNKELKIPDTTFLHYTDGSISTFKKTVVLDLNDLASTTYKYYNVFPGSIFSKRNDSYQIDYLDKVLTFKYFLLKISENKYMIVGNTFTLKIGDETRIVEGTYLEIEYLEGNIIRLENQEIALQNISSELAIIFDNVTIDLLTKNIYLNNDKKLNMNEITIDSDDNIEITSDNEDTTNKDEETENNQEEQQQNNNPNLPNINNGNIDLEDDSTEEIVDKNARIKDAEFTITSLEVTANRLRAEVKITDEENVLTGDLNIKIVEASSNKIVYQTKEDSGTNLLQIEDESLSPETNYILIINSDYEKNGVTYNKDFVQKTFVTEALGVNLKKNYITSNKISTIVEKQSYSDVVQVDVEILDSQNSTLQNKTIDLTSDSQEVIFTDLDANTKYKIIVNNFIYSNAIISDNFTIEQEYKTLKQKPVIGETSYSINKKEGEFNLNIDKITDPNNGIVSYRYEVYDARLLEENPTSLVSIEKDNKSAAVVKVDDKTIERGVPYVFKVFVIFNDNEKEIEYETDYSNIMMLEGVEFPTVRFEKKKVTFEKIEGNLIISDPGNTINLTNGSIISVIYSDSVGSTNSITASGNLNIPISINNLRSNESYTFAVFASVNLQDGNPIIDNCYIGSVVVQTESPNPFRLEYTVDESNVSNAFDITAQLISDQESDTTLEASTLSGIKFNLYSGRTTSGTLVKSVRKVDRNLEPYVSTLQTEYYDTKFAINPALFGLKNQDLTAEYYTIEVTDAYDYTSHQNNLPINNNVITVKAKGAIPDLPDDPNNAMDVTIIRNRDAGEEHYRSDLNAETIAGYRVRANYDNSKKYAKKITYYLHDAKTGEVLETKEYEVPTDGEIAYENFYINDGLGYGNKDKKFRRGEKYYFTFTILLDLNMDGLGETTYPSEGLTLKSKEIAPEKQAPILKFYPVTSTSSSYDWKYSFQDVDKATYENKLYAEKGDLNIGEYTLKSTNEDEWQILSFPVNAGGQFRLYTKEALINSEDNLLDTTHVSHYYEGLYTAQTKKYNIYLETNRVIFELSDYEANKNFYNRVAKASIKFSSGKEMISVDNILIDNGHLVVDLAKIEKLIGKTITPEVTLYYDSGVYGFETEGNLFALQQLQTNQNSELFYYVVDENHLVPRADASGSLFAKEFDLSRKRLELTEDITKKQLSLPLSFTNKGVSYNYEYISPKKIEAVIMQCENDDNTFTFDSVIPGISLLNDEGSANIAPTLVGAKIKATLSGISENKIQDNKISIEVYETDENGIASKRVTTLNKTVNDFNNIIEITELRPETNYYLKFFANVLKGESYQYTQLYDVDFQTNDRNYYFKTLGNIGISKAKVIYQASSYDDRNLLLTYNLEELIGYDRIEYEVYKQKKSETGETTWEKVELDIDSDHVFKQSMEKEIDIPVDCGVEAEFNYRIKIMPYVSDEFEGETVDVALDTETVNYTFAPLYNPYISVVRQVNDSSTLEVKINVKDHNKTVVDGKYKIVVENSEGEDVTPTEYKNVDFDISDINNRITITNVSINEQYKVKILYKQDSYNNSSKIIEKEQSYTVFLYDNGGIYIGNVYADTNLDDKTKINLSFFDSFKLTEITDIRYSIYDSTGYSIDNAIKFLPTQYHTGDSTYYQITLPDTISTNGVYYIAIQFLKNGSVVGEESLEYRYLS